MTTEKTMNFEEFKKEVTKNILSYLPEEYSESMVEISHMSKNNTELTALNIVKPGSNIAPAIYLEFFFEDYKKGKSMDFILREIANIRVKHDVKAPFDPSYLTKWENVKDKVFPRLISKEGNERLLETAVHKTWLDMEILYFGLVDMPNTLDGYGSFLVKKNILETWKISEEELHEAALENLMRAPITYKNLFDLMLEEARKTNDEDLLRMLLDPETESEEDRKYPLNILKADVGNNIFGANVLLRPDVLEKTASDIGGSFFILPSSVHEVLVTINNELPVEEMKAMVCDINAKEVVPEERLTNSIYFYDAAKKEITIVA